MIAKGRQRFVPTAITEQLFLDAGNTIAVCKRTEFVGRRRLLQRSLRCLRTWFGYEGYAEGVLLYGMSGLGKSSTAARLVERLSSTHLKALHYGRLDEISLLNSLRRVLEPKACEVLDDPNLNFYARLDKLFKLDKNPYSDKPLLIVLDDFEQNIPQQQRDKGRVNPEDYEPNSLQVLNTLLQAIYEKKSDVRVLMTCRHDVPIPAPYRLHKASLNSLQGADLVKKLKRLAGFQQASEQHQTQALTLADGNPRLLEWLDQVFLDKNIALDALFARLQAEASRFREAILLDTLFHAQNSKVRRTIALSALYRLPVPLPAVQALTEDTQTESYLVQAVRIGLVELSHEQGQAHYFVSGLLDAVLVNEIQAADREALNAKAAQALAELWQSVGSEAQRLEVLRLALISKEQSVAVIIGDKLTTEMRLSHRYKEAEKFCQRILVLGNEFRILTTLAQVQQSLGNTGNSAQINIEKAIQILPCKTGLNNDLLKERTYTLGAYADILQARGQLDEALRIRTTEELPIYEQLGDMRALLVGRTNLAITLYQKDVQQLAAEIETLLRLALTDAEQMQIPKAEQIRAIMQQMGLQP